MTWQGFYSNGELDSGTFTDGDDDEEYEYGCQNMVDRLAELDYEEVNF